MAYSSIKRKTCKCGNPKCYPSLSFQGWNFKCAPPEVKDKLGTRKEIAKRNKNARNRASLLLKKDNDADKSKLLALADKLFGNFIKERDSDKDGNVICPCCKLSFNVGDKDSEGNSIVQPLHFVSRAVYSLRFDETQVYAGDSGCNLHMHLYPDGVAVVNYQNMLIEKLGIVEVMRMVAQKRVVNKLTVNDLKEVIEKYKPKTEK